MKKIFSLFCCLATSIALQAQIIRVPVDFPTIQAGINHAEDGDTVLVSPGTYFENLLIFNKKITLASLFLTTQDTSYISQTIIDGNRSSDVIQYYYTGSTSLLCGFRITNGYSKEGLPCGIHCVDGSSPILQNLIITGNAGGGILCGDNSDPTLIDVSITNNAGIGIACYSPVLINVLISGNTGGGISGGSPSLENVIITGNKAEYGGGIWCYSAVLKNVTITGNYAKKGGGIYITDPNIVFDSIERSTIHSNFAVQGNDLYSEASRVHLVLDTFSVITPGEFHAAPVGNFTFDILHGKHELINADAYVSPAGNDNNSGLTPGEPLRTIHSALSYILADSLTPRIIHLSDGTYSPDISGEFFPVCPRDHVKIYGSGNTQVILDADSTAEVIRFQDTRGAGVAGMTIKKGSAGGIICENSSPVIQDLSVTGNYGNGIHCENSSPIVQNVHVFNNNGNGIYCNNNSSPHLQSSYIIDNNGTGISCHENSNPLLSHVTISKNTSNNGSGGGLYCSSSAPVFDSLDRCNIYLNYALEGYDLYSDTLIKVIVDTFSVLNPNAYHATPVSNFSFDILHGYYDQVDADLYVSPSGNNSNSGLTSLEPLKNIRSAFSRILADSLHRNTVHLLRGTYSPSATNELFPVIMHNHLDLQGEDKQQVILDAQKTATVFQANDNNNSKISGMTFTGGNGIDDNKFERVAGGIDCSSNITMEDLIISGNSGRGILIKSCNPVLRNIEISGNAVNGSGGGICISNGSPYLDNIQVRGNSVYPGGYGCILDPGLGGGIFCQSNDDKPCHPIIKNSIITENRAEEAGGGIYLESCSLTLENTKITHNRAEVKGGGIYCSWESEIKFDSLNRCNIYLNFSPYGNEIYSEKFLNVIVDTFTVLNPTKFLADPLSNFHFNIQHGLHENVNADLYVSPAGNDLNPGLNADAPLRTIHAAFSFLDDDNLDPHTVHLLEGTYSPTSNGELFPVVIPDFVNLEGVADTLVTLDADSVAEVIRFSGNNKSLLSDMTITGGGKYGGIVLTDSRPLLKNLLITGNSWDGKYYNYSPFHAAGITMWESSPVLQHCRIYNNRTYLWGGSNYIGLGMLILGGSPVLKNVIVSDNTAIPYAEGQNWVDIVTSGGIFLRYSNPFLQDVIISGNSVAKGISRSGTLGGGIYLEHSNPQLQNILISGNSATIGGGIFCESSSPVLKNATITDNYSDYNNAIYIRSSFNPSLPVFINSIVWGNHPGSINDTSAIITWSDIQGGWPGEGNIDADPLFDTTGIYPFALLSGSPCINSGKPDTAGLNLPLTDLAGNPRIWGGRVDMGAYEWNNLSIDDTRFILHDLKITNHPNPVNGFTTFCYELKESGRVTLLVYNTFGQMACEVVNELQQKGEQRIPWNARSLPAGVYFYRIQCGNHIGNGKMLIQNNF